MNIYYHTRCFLFLLPCLICNASYLQLINYTSHSRFSSLLLPTWERRKRKKTERDNHCRTIFSWYKSPIIRYSDRVENFPFLEFFSTSSSLTTTTIIIIIISSNDDQVRRHDYDNRSTLSFFFNLSFFHFFRGVFLRQNHCMNIIPFSDVRPDVCRIAGRKKVGEWRNDFYSSFFFEPIAMSNDFDIDYFLCLVHRPINRVFYLLWMALWFYPRSPRPLPIPSLITWQGSSRAMQVRVARLFSPVKNNGSV